MVRSITFLTFISTAEQSLETTRLGNSANFALSVVSTGISGTISENATGIAHPLAVRKHVMGIDALECLKRHRRKMRINLCLTVLTTIGIDLG